MTASDRKRLVLEAAKMGLRQPLRNVDTIILRWQEFSGSTATLEGDGRIYEEIAAGREAAAA